MKPLLIGVFFILATSVSRADCLQVSGKDFDLRANDIGSGAFEWKAEIENRCRETFDADLTVHLLDAEGNRVYAVRNLETLGYKESRKVGKHVYVPSHIVDQVESIDIEVEERKRKY